METKNTIGFILGRETALCAAEIFAVLGRQNIEYKIEYFKPPVLILSAAKNDLPFSIKTLGGTIKIFDLLENKLDKDSLLKAVKKLEVSQKDQRINFGLSGYGKINQKFLYHLGKDLKNNFLENGHKARFVTGKTNDLSSVIVTENKLLTRGFELIIIKDNENYLLGKTREVQDYKSYGKRDFGRPRRDDRNGMLPPKVAQIMINLAQTSIKSTLYDPFCGGGTILQEAALSGYENIYGSDLSEKQMEDTRVNLSWLEQLYCSNKIDESHLFMADMTTFQPSFKADAIISEGYLGKPSRKTVAEAESEIKDLALFYEKVLNNLKTIISANGIVVLAIPFFIIEGKHYYLPLIEKLGEFKLQKPIPDGQQVKLSPRKTLTYHRLDQFVGREILILK